MRARTRSASSSTARRSRTGRAAATRSPTTRSSCCSTRSASRSRSRCRPGASARGGRSSSRPATARRRASWPRAPTCTWRAARSCCSGVPEFRCTYRLQLTPDFGFAKAREIAVPYAQELGVSHLYLSPSLQARHGSLHGYDVTDPTRISEDLGGEAAFRALCDAAHAADLGVVLDIVPNHMATSEEET